MSGITVAPLKNGFSKALSLFLCITFAVPVNAQSYPSHLEKEFREDATLKVKRVVKIYNEARVEFEKKGGNAFAKKLNELSRNTFTPSEEKFLAKKAAKEQLLPILEVNGDFLIAYEGKKVVFKLSTFDVAQGRFNFKDQTLLFNSNTRVIENYEKWTATKTSFLNSTFFEFFALKLKSLLVPEAHAFSKGTGALIGAAIGGLLTYFLWPKIKEWFGGKPEVASTAHEAPLAPLNIPAPAPAAPATTAPAAAASAADAATTAPAAATPPEPPAEAGLTDDQSSAVNYIASKYPDSEVNSLADIWREQEIARTNPKAPYPIQACKILNRLKSELKSDKPEKVSKEVAKFVFIFLTKDQNSNTITSLDSFESSTEPKVKCSDTKKEVEALLK